MKVECAFQLQPSAFERSVVRPEESEVNLAFVAPTRSIDRNSILIDEDYLPPPSRELQGDAAALEPCSQYSDDIPPNQRPSGSHKTRCFQFEGDERNYDLRSPES